MQLHQEADRALALADKGLKRLEKYLSDEPNDVAVRDLCLKLHGNKAFILEPLDRPSEAAREWAWVVELSPEPVPHYYRIFLARALVQSGDVATAAVQEQLVKRDSVRSADDLYNLAAYHALCAGVAKRDERTTPEEREKLVESQTEEALLWLRSAVDAGLFNDPAARRRALTDDSFIPVRDHPEFGRLIELVETKP